MHIAQIGTGKVGHPTAYTVMCSKLADKLTVSKNEQEAISLAAQEIYRTYKAVINGSD
jgi:hypothetical protein